MNNDKYIYKIIEVKQKYRTTREERFKVKSPECIFDFLVNKIGNSTQEEFVVLGLNTKNEVTLVHSVFKGSINASVVHPREVFRTAIANSCANIIIAHNHPSGDPTPSIEDIEATRRMMSAGNLLGIEVLDHIIVCEDRYMSIREQGLV